jgi:hypothetical protein
MKNHNMSNNKVLLILERANGNLQVNKDSGDYVLEGIFAQFGVENNNKRIYEEKEYLPHLDYLKKQIAENRLMGELDHPEKFEVSLQKVSHVVESLEYDSKNRQIVGRVRLLNTPAGNIAKNLVDSGIPVSISSRAAGSVTESKKVEIKRIFTYDLVAHPGFENAQLNRVNESFGLDSDDNLQIFDASAWSAPMYETTLTENNDKKENNTMKNYVTEEAMQKYSVLLKEEFEKINTAISDIKESNSSIDKIKALEEKVEQIKEYANLLGSELNESNGNFTKLKEYANHLSGELTEAFGFTESVKNYTNHLSEEITDNRGYSEHLRESINNGINYTENEVAARVDQLVEYVKEEVTPHVQKIIEHNNHIVNELNTHIEWTEENGKIIEKLAEHNDYLAGEIEKNRAYASYISENAVENSDFKNLVEYAEFMFENYEGGTKIARGNNISEDKDTKKQSTVKEDALPTATEIRGRVSSVSNKIDAVLEQIKKEKIEANSDDKRFPSLSLLGENIRAEFSKLDETKKEKVGKALNESKALSAEGLEIVYANALKETSNVEPKWLAQAPKKYREIYEGLSESDKTNVQKAATWYANKLDTEYQIKNFWETRGIENIVLENLNESVIAKGEEKPVNQLGYSNELVSSVAQSLRRRK